MKVRFHKPTYFEKELTYIQEAVTRNHYSGSGKFTEQCTEKLKNITKANNVLLTHSCTGALELACMLEELKPGDEVILPSYTFCSTASAVVSRGATPVFADIGDDFNISPEEIQKNITSKTKAIIPVHYAGQPCEMDAITSIAEEKHLAVIEDAAQTIYSFDNNDLHLGTKGDCATLSFHDSKNIHCGQGGALLLSNKVDFEKARCIWEKGTNRSAFFEGKVDKYTWVELGSSFLMPEINAAWLLAQLEMVRVTTLFKRETWNHYYNSFKPLQEQEKIKLPIINSKNHNAHFFYIVTRDKKERSSLIEYLKNAGIDTTFHYIPLHSSPAGLKYGKARTTLKKTDHMANRVLRLPLWYGMSRDQVDHVVEKTLQFYHGEA